MSVAGLCQLCESARADHRCDRCGSLVCDAHFDVEVHACIECVRDGEPGGLRF